MDPLLAFLSHANATEIAAFAQALAPVLNAVPQPGAWDLSINLFGATLVRWEFVIVLYLYMLITHAGVFVGFNVFSGFDVQSLAQHPTVSETLGTLTVVLVPALVTLGAVAFFSVQNAWVAIAFVFTTLVAANMLYLHTRGRLRRKASHPPYLFVYVCMIGGPIFSLLFIVAEIADWFAFRAWLSIARRLRIDGDDDNNGSDDTASLLSNVVP